MSDAIPDGDQVVPLEQDPLSSQASLRFVICGNAGGGKSTMFGRILAENGMNGGSKKTLSGDRDIDLAGLVDGLNREGEYRSFSTRKRHFSVADMPGHEHHTRDMAMAASRADLAIMVVDANEGIVTQTKRHSYIVGLLGIRNVVLAINKIDLVDDSENTFNALVGDYREFAAQLPEEGCVPFDIVPIPVSALAGDNVAVASDAVSWFKGTPLLPYLETVEIEQPLARAPFRLPVQRINQTDGSASGVTGQIVSGEIGAGDRVKVLPSAKSSGVKAILAGDGDVRSAGTGQSVSLVLDDAIDISPGDMIAAADAPPEVADQFEVTLLWMADDPLLAGRAYDFQSATTTGQLSVTAIKHTINVDSLEHQAATTLKLNDLARCTISADRKFAFDPYLDNRETGGFTLVDPQTNDVLGTGFIHFALRRASNIHWQATEVSRSARSAMKDQKSAILWFTGLSGSGKSTIASILEKKLAASGKHTTLLDGDNVRHGLNKDLGFTDADRVENIRRVSEVARLMGDAGLIALVSFISPFIAERRMARDIAGDVDFIEIYVDTPLQVAEARDVKGLYKKARAGEIKNFTGIDSPYEPPEDPEMVIDTVSRSAEKAADLILEELKVRDVI